MLLNHSPVRCWIFDVDDTLVKYVGFNLYEWYEFIALPVAEKYGIPLDFSVWKGMINGKVSRRYSENFGVPAEIFWKEVDARNLEYRKWMYRQNRLRVYDDVKAIAYLNGYKIAWSASSKDCINYVLSLFNIASLFDFVIGKDYENYKHIDDVKPSPKFIEIIKDRFKCEDCIVIGDSERDMLAARKGGCIGVLVRGKESKYADFKIDSLWELQNKKFL